MACSGYEQHSQSIAEHLCSPRRLRKLHWSDWLSQILVMIRISFRSVFFSSPQALRTAFSSIAAESSRGAMCLGGSAGCDGATQTSMEPFPCRSDLHAQQSCQGPAVLPTPFCEQLLLTMVLSGQIFLWKLGHPPRSEGATPACQNGTAIRVLLEWLGPHHILHRVWNYFFPWESIQLFNFPCMWRCTSLHSHFQHLTSAKIPKIF